MSQRFATSEEHIDAIICSLWDCGKWHECEENECEHRALGIVRDEQDGWVDLCEECAGNHPQEFERNRCDEPGCSQRWTVKTREELVYCTKHARDYVVVRNKGEPTDAP